MIYHQFAYSSMSMRKVKEAEFGILFVSRLCSCRRVVADNGRQQHRLRQPSPDPFSSNKLMQIAPNAHGKLRAIIELMALRVREKQRLLRAQVVERFFHWIEKISVVHVVQHCVMHEQRSSLSASNVQIASAA